MVGGGRDGAERRSGGVSYCRSVSGGFFGPRGLAPGRRAFQSEDGAVVWIAHRSGRVGPPSIGPRGVTAGAATPRLERRLRTLNRLVRREWDGVSVRVTEAWDENAEHGPSSAHYEGRAVDLTTSDIDPAKLGRLAFLAVEAGFDRVYFEDRTHVHASVRR